MGQPRKRTKRLSRKVYKTPGARIKTKNSRRKFASARCAICNAKLASTSAGRKYSGTLCHTCTETVIKYRTRVAGGMPLNTVPIKYQSFARR